MESAPRKLAGKAPFERHAKGAPFARAIEEVSRQWLEGVETLQDGVAPLRLLPKEWRALPCLKKSRHDRKLIEAALEDHRAKGLSDADLMQHYLRKSGARKLGALRLQELIRKGSRSSRMT
eukprot:Plantae.Rhodophyta-Hildenbrandia_rubra.ctg20025.p1 GENE.Plantae.Rhodophyta-Hildenbrandia_rubra.ctg20025~~Plantae.Rhodophyta-Hildenbrandia_rubra.ctg20025.p1  ORF type:complete len:121 (-),score=18.70 Plantae.Rhodophyta-Hildenbrandia_rubra.ctg20025:100-462(-)